ncbi:HalOD1 output domain-containing protein [Natronosalvus halobius]|uniref:HalOD1 output domain-containing protein n=1 Tax=Natronosalvus halobius TaxID=2953746 RepID=UPI00209DBD83|nr:HalOD1 output domain-containing protein [Natronosalvus halobius]USZ73525.1 hypothetical protein NGM15_17835 [Natronosalvus halobius]
MTPGYEEFDYDSSTVVEHRCGESTPASIAVVQAIGAIEGVDPTEAPEELGFTLYDHVDPEALDAMVEDGSRTGGVTIEFSLEGHRVLITDTGLIRVQPTE